MKFMLDDLLVIFPYELIYPEQLNYMKELKTLLDHDPSKFVSGMIEMPSGTGKTVTLLSFIVSYMLQNRNKFSKLVYCTRTVGEIDQVMNELKNVFSAIKKIYPDFNLTSTCLTSRKNLCINNEILQNKENLPIKSFKDSQEISHFIDCSCRALLKNANDINCQHYKKLVDNKDDIFVYTPQTTVEMTENCDENSYCPYYRSRMAIETADIVVFNYYYVLDPKISEIITNNLLSNCIVVFDEAHNIDTYCCEAFTVVLAEHNIFRCLDNINTLKNHPLLQKIGKAIETLTTSNMVDFPAELNLPVDSKELIEQLLPGPIRLAENFLNFLSRIANYLLYVMSSEVVIIENPSSFLKKMYTTVFLDHRSLRYCKSRLKNLLVELGLENDSSFSSLIKVADFVTVMATYQQQGFCILIEPFEHISSASVRSPKITLSCNDATLAMAAVFKKYSRVVITSGTLTPLSMYPRLLNFHPLVSKSLGTNFGVRRPVCPIIVNRANDNTLLSSKFEDRENLPILKYYGSLVYEMCCCVPDGLVCFFASYRHMETCMSVWNEIGLLTKIQKVKLIFAETPKLTETTVALSAYRQACKIGRGAVFFSVSRGKVSEGIDFHHFYGRAVLVLGVPYANTTSQRLRCRLEYLNEKFAIREQDFLTFDALRHASQCLGRAIRGKTDYGLMVLADYRYGKTDKMKRLPVWIQQQMTPQNSNLSIEQCVNVSRRFLRQMGQPFKLQDQIGTALLNESMAADFLKL